MHTIFYRLFRLRRLIGVSSAWPLLAVAVVYLLKGPAALALAPVAVLLPVVHVLRYPNAWMETLTLSITLTVLLMLGGTIGPDVGLVGLGLRLLALGLLGFGLFLVLTAVVSSVISLGRHRPITTRARHWTRLSPEEVKRGVTLYPGREDDKVTCGPANEDGIFEVTMHLDLSAFACAMEAEADGDMGADGEAEISATMTDLKAEMEKAGLEHIDVTYGIDAEGVGTYDATFFALVSHSDDTCHDVIVLEEDAEEATVTRMTFTPKDNGTLVSMDERSTPMPKGYGLGFWLQDYGADYLVDEIDRAEGRALRANRSAGQASLLEDIALRMSSKADPVTPAE